jgi:Tfp pilus assembly protein FimT
VPPLPQSRLTEYLVVAAIIAAFVAVFVLPVLREWHG